MTSTLLADTVHQRMLGNTKRFFGSAEDKEGEDEEDEEERLKRLKQNGMIDMGDKEYQNRAGRKTDGSKPAAVVIGWQRGERQPRAVNSAQRGIPHLPSQPTLYHQTTNQPLYHPVLTNQQARRRVMERSMTTVTPLEDSQFAVIVFRIGIPDIKQTVCAFLFTHTSHALAICTNDWPIIILTSSLLHQFFNFAATDMVQIFAFANINFTSINNYNMEA